MSEQQPVYNPYSVLQSVKTICNVHYLNDAFDSQIIPYINATLSEMFAKGIGPKVGMSIIDDTTLWTEWFKDDYIGAVTTYVGMSVRKLFDPPMSGPLMTALNESISKAEFFLMLNASNAELETPLKEV